MAHDRGQPRDFEAFYAATAEATYETTRRMAAGDRHLALEATQEAYLAMLGQWAARRSRAREDNRRYVLGIAAHKVVDAYRAKNKHVELDEDIDVPLIDPAFGQVLDEMTVLATVRELIACQPPRRRAVGILFFLQDLSYHEIAAALQMNQSTVRTHVERLRVILKPHIERAIELSRGGERR